MASRAIQFEQWASVDPPTGWSFLLGNFTQDTKADLFGYHPSNGTLWIGENTGGGFSFSQWASVTPVEGWRFVAGDFTGSGRTDVAGYHPSNGSVWLGTSTVRPVEGYCWPLSAAPGETISFMTSGEGATTVVFERHTSVSNGVDSTVMDTTAFTGTVRPVPVEPWRVGCDWLESFNVTIPPSWPSGIYSATCTDADDGRCAITFVVKPTPAETAPIAVLANANTWLAYNGWGGQSKYSGRARVSFLRPNPGAALAGDYHLTRGELWPLGWLEVEGQRPDVYTDIDFHNGIDISRYRGLMLTTHPEYWSTQMYDNLVGYLNQGGSLLYLAGNGIFESGAYEADQHGMSFRLGIEGGPRESALFRVLSPARPERAVLGVATERCGVEGSAFEVLHSDHFCFAGTGLANGDTFGAAGLNTGYGNGKASAWEVDTFDGPGSLHLPTACDMQERPVPAAAFPNGLVVVARGQFDGVGRGADMVYYDHPGGGFVFAAGSLTFGGSLVIDPVIQAIYPQCIGEGWYCVTQGRMRCSA